MTTWLKLPEAARYAQVSAATIRREVARGALRAYRVGGRKALRFRADDVDSWLRAGATIERNPDVICVTCDVPADPGGTIHQGHHLDLARVR
jgi:excisionase family DNA binding protein